MADGTPVSRFWACFFSHTLVALLWTLKMKKTQRWLLVTLLPEAGVYGAFGLALVISIGLHDAGLPDRVVLAVSLTPVSMMASAAIVAPIYYMHKWTTAYNLENFGCKSKGEWRRDGVEPSDPGI